MTDLQVEPAQERLPQQVGLSGGPAGGRRPQPDRLGAGIIERTFGETRRRVKVIVRFPGETSCVSLVWAVLDRAARGWRGFTSTSTGLRILQDLRRALLHPPTQLHPTDDPALAPVTEAV
ncbi:hypothetical protein LDL49_05735 [Nonomuraea sp. NEAU-L178]|nr:hypothetical protein [Nonomuraea aurantiaca]MCA2220732.1 hypothetical protein [Nonomuraea aurantiaca]